jgi:hypothetical protein
VHAAGKRECRKDELAHEPTAQTKPNLRPKKAAP